MSNTNSKRTVDAVIFDYGGVLAEEGFFLGFDAIGERFGRDGGELAEVGVTLARAEGYAEGRMSEADFWNRWRERTGIEASDDDLRGELLSRWALRPFMMAYVDKLRKAGYKLAILSDQTNWLDEMEEKNNIYGQFDVVRNSWHTGMTKKDPRAFEDVLVRLGVTMDRALFVDDHGGHIRRAAKMGLKAIHYTDREAFEADLVRHCPDIF